MTNEHASEERRRPEDSEDGREKSKKSPIKPMEMDFDGDEDWREQVRELLLAALGEKYKSRLSGISNKYVDEEAVNDNLDDIDTIEITEGGILKFKGDDMDNPLTFDVKDGIDGALRERIMYSRDITMRRYMRLRRAVAPRSQTGGLLDSMNSGRRGVKGGRAGSPGETGVRRPGATGGLLDSAAATSGPDGRAAGGAGAPSGPDAPGRRRLSPAEEAARSRMDKVLSSRKAQRERILGEAERMKDEEYDFYANISRTLQDDDPEAFQRNWRAMDYSEDVEELFAKKPKIEEGYTHNPFKEQGWTSEELRKLMQDCSDGQLHFQEVADAIYNDRVEDFEKQMRKQGVPEVIIDLLDDEDLAESYKRLKKISTQLEGASSSNLPDDDEEEYEEILPHLDKLNGVLQILGDYVVFANRLVNLVGKLKYNPAQEATDRERMAHEFEVDARGVQLENPSNHVKLALAELFKRDVASPREYESELSHIFSSTPGRRITFEDLNGRTATVDGEWFTTAQSSDAAYSLAFTEIVKQKQGPDGRWTETVDEAEAATHINTLLSWGIACYTVMPAHKSMKSIMGEMQESGILIKWTGDPKIDQQNLFKTLAINNLEELYRKGSPAADLVDKYRKMFVRVGSVVWQKNQFEKQRRLAEGMKEKGMQIEFKPEQADEIVARLREAGFDEVKLKTIRSALIGGAAIVLPDYGGGFSIHYEFDNGTLVDISGMFPGWEPFSAGAAVGKKIEMSPSVTVTIHGAAGYSFAEAGGGWMVGAGGSVTKKFESVDFSVKAAGGLLVGPMIPTGLLGVGLNWEKSNEKYRKTLNRKAIEEHLAEVDASSDKYATVKEHPSRYPELSRILYKIENVPGLDEPSKKELFETAYGMFKEGMAEASLDESTKEWYERFIPTGADLGVVMVGPVPVPYVALEFQLWSRKLVYRIARGSEEESEQFTDAQVRSKIAEQTGATVEIKEKQLATSGELIFDPVSNQFKLKKAFEGTIDFAHLERFNEFRDALASEAGAKIFVEPTAQKGLFLLSPREAYGNTKVYIDPALKDDVIVVAHGGRLYISVKKDKQIFVRREDVNFPFEHRGAVEETAIFITADQHVNRDVIEDTSTHYFEQQPGKVWQRRPNAAVEELPEIRDKDPQTNLQTWDEYIQWWGTGKTDRLEVASTQELKAAYTKLTASVEMSHERGNDDLRIRKPVQEKIDTMVKDEKFIQEFRRLTTEGYNIIKDKREVISNWEPHFPELSIKIKARIGQDVNAAEMNAALGSLLVASFMNIQKKNPKQSQEEYKKFLESFERPMLTSIFQKYYEGKPEAEKKVAAAVDWIIKKLEGVDVSQAGEMVKSGYYFSTLVGMGKVYGMRRMYNFNETDGKYGLVGGSKMNVADKGMEGEIADFWLKKLSPYRRGLGEKEKGLESSEQMKTALHSPLAMKLVPMLGVLLSPQEMGQLTKFYSSDLGTEVIDASNLPVVKKLLTWCDKVRTAELDGKDRIELENGFALLIKVEVKMGVFKKCGNISGLIKEDFALLHKGSKKVYFAAMSEGYIDVEAGYTRVDYSMMVGAAMPIVKKEEVGGGGGGGEEETEVPADNEGVGQKDNGPAKGVAPSGSTGGGGAEE